VRGDAAGQPNVTVGQLFASEQLGAAGAQYSTALLMALM
jgi:hypothetical protein